MNNEELGLARHNFKDFPSTQRWQICFVSTKVWKLPRSQLKDDRFLLFPQKFWNHPEVKSGDIVSYNFSVLNDDSSNQTHEVVNSTSVGSDQVLIASNEKVLLQNYKCSCSDRRRNYSYGKGFIRYCSETDWLSIVLAN